MILANGLTGTIGKNLVGQVSQLEGDLKSNEQVKRLSELDDVGVLIHLAGIVGAKAVDDNPQLAMRVNVDSLAELGEAFFRKKSGKFVYISTSHVYAPSIHKLTEDSQILPQSEYANQKLLGENYLKAIFSNSPERLLIIRVFSVLGWGMPKFTLGGAIEYMMENSSAQISNVDDQRDFLSPKTIASNIYDLAKATDVWGTINLCSGHSRSVSDAVVRMLKARGISVDKSRLIGGVSSNPIIIGDNSKLLSLGLKLDLEWTVE
jgi:nucleoside-diphosphate-sugar epimerase